MRTVARIGLVCCPKTGSCASRYRRRVRDLLKTRWYATVGGTQVERSRRAAGREISGFVDTRGCLDGGRQGLGNTQRGSDKAAQRTTRLQCHGPRRAAASARVVVAGGGVGLKSSNSGASAHHRRRTGRRGLEGLQGGRGQGTEATGSPQVGTDCLRKVALKRDEEQQTHRWQNKNLQNPSPAGLMLARLCVVLW